MKKIILLLLVFIANSFLVIAQNFPAKPTNYVSDEAGLLSSSEQNELNTKLKALEEKNTNQVFIYIAKSLNGNNLEDYTQQIFDAWQVGQKGKDNGVLLTVFIEDRKFRIQTGYGVEAILPDVTCNTIQEEYIIPNFKNEDYFDGLDEATDAMIDIIGGKSIQQIKNEKEFAPGIGTIIFASIILLIQIVVAISLKPKNNIEKRIQHVFNFVLILSIILPFVVLKLKTNEMSFQLLLQSYIVIGINIIVSLIGIFIVTEYAKSDKTKHVNSILFLFYTSIASFLYLKFVVTENVSLNNLTSHDSYDGVYAMLATTTNCLHMFITLLILSPSTGSSSGGSFGGNSRSSSWSYSSGSSSSRSSFSGGGGGRSGGGGSSGSW